MNSDSFVAKTKQSPLALFMPGEKKRKSLRLKEYDYSRPGAYFVTICTKNREKRFGAIVDGEMRENDLTAVVQSCWEELPHHYPNVELDEFVVMPNHIHGIIIILDRPVGATHASPQREKRNTLGNIIGSFKSAVTKQANELRKTSGITIWQRGYYEHIVRDDRSLIRIREYISQNPQRWALNGENSSAPRFEKGESTLSRFEPN